MFDVKSFIAVPAYCGEHVFGMLYADSGQSDFYFLTEDLYWFRLLGLAAGFVAVRLSASADDGESVSGLLNE